MQTGFKRIEDILLDLLLLVNGGIRMPQTYNKVWAKHIERIIGRKRSSYILYGYSQALVFRELSVDSIHLYHYCYLNLI